MDIADHKLPLDDLKQQSPRELEEQMIALTRQREDADLAYRRRLEDIARERNNQEGRSCWGRFTSSIQPEFAVKVCTNLTRVAVFLIVLTSACVLTWSITTRKLADAA
jgi:hypothetical protein